MNKKRVATICILAAMWALSSSVAMAAIKTWNTGNGFWNVPGNWTLPGVPVASDVVRIVNTDGVARTVTLDVSTPALGLVSLDLTGPGTAANTLAITSNNSITAAAISVGGYNGMSHTNGRGAVNQSAGTVTMSPGADLILAWNNSGSTGTYTLSGGAIVANQGVWIGHAGTGVFNHSGGTHTINASAAGGFLVAGLAGSTGTYNLSGSGILTSNAPEYIGNSGNGTFNQTGGTNLIEGTNNNLYLGYNAGSFGAYTLNAGNLSVMSAEFIGYSATGNASQSGGTFNQSGGTHVVVRELVLGFNGGSTGTYTLSAGSLSSRLGLFVGLNGTGTFNQSGGTNLVDDNFYVGFRDGATGTYTLSGGILTVESISFIGDSGKATFTQTGGSYSSGSLLVGGFSSAMATFNLTGGLVSAQSIVGAQTGGVISVGGTGVLTVAGLLFSNSAASSINLQGGTINAAALNFVGQPTRFNWTTGTLNLTTDVTWDSAAGPNTTGAAFDTSRTLASNQTLMITGNETLGGTGSFSLTLNSGSTHQVTGTLSVNPTGTLTQNAGSTLFAAAIVQAGGIVNGMLQNQGNFVYQTGSFTGRLLNQGTASLEGPTNFITGDGVENDGTMSVAAGQTLTVNGAGLDNVGDFTLSGGTISGSGPVVNNFGGSLVAGGTINSTLTNNGILELDGVLRLNAGTNTNNGIVRGIGTLVGAFSNAAGGTVDLAADDQLAISHAWTNSGLVTLDDGTLLGGGTITNLGTIQGAGTVNSTVANSGVVRASGGQLNLAAASNTNPAAGLIQASSGNTLMYLRGLTTNAGTIGLTGGAFDNNNRPLANSGIINGYGVIRTSVLTNTNGLNVGEGNMDVFGSVTNNGTIGVQGGRSIYFFGPVSGSGSFTGTGTAVFLAAVSPGSSPDAVSFDGNATLASTSSLNIEVGGIAAGTQYDQLLVAGELALGGTLELSLINGFIPSAGHSFNILDWGSLAGTFSSLNLPSLAGLVWNTSQLYTTGVLSLAVAGLPGDYNQNGNVDAADYVVWRNTLGQAGAGLAADGNGNNQIDNSDYGVWRAHFGQTAGSAASGVGLGEVASYKSAVPEPSAIVIAGIAVSCLIARRRKMAEARHQRREKNLRLRQAHAAVGTGRDCCLTRPQTVSLPLKHFNLPVKFRLLASLSHMPQESEGSRHERRVRRCSLLADRDVVPFSHLPHSYGDVTFGRRGAGPNARHHYHHGVHRRGGPAAAR